MNAVKSYIPDHLKRDIPHAATSLPLPEIEVKFGLDGKAIFSSPALPGETSPTWGGLFWLLNFLEVI